MRELPFACAFVYIGRAPASECVPAAIGRDSAGLMVPDAGGRTSDPRIYCYGSLRSGCQGGIAAARADGERRSRWCRRPEPGVAELAREERC